MKTRLNYVSNSSSSSYIIEYKNLEQTVRIAGEEISMRSFLEAFNDSKDTDSELFENTINGKEYKNQLLEKLNSNLEWMEDNEEKVKLIELKKDIENSGEQGPFFVKLNLGYHNHSLNFLFRLLHKYELFKIRDIVE